ncbi:hypothetical protein ACOKFD_07610 [Flagellimonas sp. S174]|uniref:hypothetical protein n=1 Tax=Flagellimonas sp. S174 TaxID=3410790 RepID=UPI003BF585A4
MTLQKTTEPTYEQPMMIYGKRIIVTYNYDWMGHTPDVHAPPPVSVKMYPGKKTSKDALVQDFDRATPHVLFVIREYLSIVADRFQGIEFEYQWMNHSVKINEYTGRVSYCEAELKWSYKDSYYPKTVFKNKTLCPSPYEWAL